MRKNRLYYLLIGLIIILLATSVSVMAQEELIIETNKEELQPRERIKVQVSVVNQDGTEIKEDMELLVGVSKGGLTEPEILSQGLKLNKGKGEFTYIAPSNTGTARILLIDMKSNISAKQRFKIVEQQKKTNWQQQSAKIIKIQGQVAVKKEEKRNWDAALTGTKLQPGDSIKTWGDSWVTFKLFDGSKITLEPWTTIYIKSLRQSAENEELKQSVMKVITGNILCNAQKYLTPGAKFEVETESSAAGVRGTNFEFVLGTTGNQEVIVYEGEVIFEHFSEGLLFPVKAGEKLLLSAGKFKMPKIDSHNITPEEKLKKIREEQEKTKKKREEDDESLKGPGIKDSKDQAEAKSKKDQTEETNEKQENDESVNKQEQNKEQEAEVKKEEHSSSDLSNLKIGSKQVAEKMYFTFSWQPEFEQILGSGLSLGLDLTFYQDPETSNISLGSSAENAKVDNIINWIEYNGEYTYLYYGVLEDISYGSSLLMSNYEKEGAKGTQLGLNNLTPANLGFRVLLPTDLKSIYPWKTRQTSSLYATRVTSDFKFMLPWQLGVNYVVDTNKDLLDLEQEVPTRGLSTDLKLPTIKLGQPYLEVAKLIDFGSGAEVGIKGELASIFWYQTGIRAVGENFMPNYFGEDYEYLKANTITEPTNEMENLGRTLANLNNNDDYPATTGAYLKGGMDLGLANLTLGYEDYTDQSQYAPVLTSNGDASTPEIKLLSIPVVKGGYNYRQTKFGEYDQGVNSLLNKNTRFSWYVKYPIKTGVFLTLNNEFIPADNEINYAREFNLSFSF